MNDTNSNPENVDSFFLDLIQVLLYGVLALFGVYTTFIVAGPIFEQFLPGDLKLAAAAGLAIILPVLTALGESSRREGGRRVYGPMARMARICLATAIFSFGTAVIIAMTMPGNVCTQLRNNPNWFIDQDQRVYGPETQVENFNRRYSAMVADGVEKLARTFGIYKWQGYNAQLDIPSPERRALASRGPLVADGGAGGPDRGA